MSRADSKQQYTEETTPNEAPPTMTSHTQQLATSQKMAVASVVTTWKQEQRRKTAPPVQEKLRKSDWGQTPSRSHSQRSEQRANLKFCIKTRLGGAVVLRRLLVQHQKPPPRRRRLPSKRRTHHNTCTTTTNHIGQSTSDTPRGCCNARSLHKHPISTHPSNHCANNPELRTLHTTR